MLNYITKQETMLASPFASINRQSSNRWSIQKVCTARVYRWIISLVAPTCQYETPSSRNDARFQDGHRSRRFASPSKWAPASPPTLQIRQSLGIADSFHFVVRLQVLSLCVYFDDSTTGHMEHPLMLQKSPIK